MNGTVFKRCPCTEKSKKNTAGRRRQACKKNHGSWYFRHDTPALPGEKARTVVQRGGHATKEAAQEALVDSLKKYQQRGVMAEQDREGRRRFVADYLQEWLDGRLDLKPSTRHGYQRQIDRYLIPHLGHLRLEELTTGHIEAMYAEMRKLRSRRRKKTPGRDRRRSAEGRRKHNLDGREQLTRGELRSAVLSYLRDRPGQEFTAYHVSQDLGRAKTAVKHALLRLVELGDAVIASERPRRFAASPAGNAGSPPVPAEAEAPAMWRLSPASIQRTHAVLRSALNDSVRRRILDVNPAQFVSLEVVRAPRARFWDSQQAGWFLDGITEDRLCALYHLAIYRGPRRGELIALRWEDIDLDEGLCEIRRNIVQVGYTAHEGTPKTLNGERILALDLDTVSVLKAHRERQQAEEDLLGAAYQDHGLVFAREDGRPLQPEYVSRHLDVLIRQVGGLPRITFHQLRHTAAALMIEDGADLKYVQYVLGHADINITGTLYAKVTIRLDRMKSGQIASRIPRERLLPADMEPQDQQSA